jgi:hypothetical protein
MLERFFPDNPFQPSLTFGVECSEVLHLGNVQKCYTIQKAAFPDKDQPGTNLS